MRFLIKYLLSLCAFFLFWQHAFAVAGINGTATADVTAAYFNDQASNKPEFLITSHKEILQLNLIGFIEEIEDKWSVSPLHFAKLKGDTPSFTATLPLAASHSFIPRFSRQPAVGVLACPASRCLAFCVFRI